jgi:hemerythrin-like domain-containing protein
MKRNENLVLLSRDHHFALLCCWKIREGIKKNISHERIRKYINYFWHENLSRHFETEEVILPASGNESLEYQMENEHTEIRRLMNSLNQSGDSRLLMDFADALKRHIRFEERVYFPHLEENLSAEKMSGIGEKLHELHHKEEDNYPDEFWK